MKTSPVIAAVIVLLIACRREEAPDVPAPHRGAHVHEADSGSEEPEAAPNRVKVTDEVARKAGLRTEAVSSRALLGTLELTGELVADPDARALVTARMAGRIVDVRFRDSELVRVGQALVVIESAELARSRAVLTGAQAKANTAKRNLDRLQALVEKGLASGQEVDAAKAELTTVGAEALAARQTLASFGVNATEVGDDAARVTITSPIAGRVIHRTAVRGESVAADRVLAEVANLDSAYFIARVFEQDLAFVSARAKAEVRLNAYPNEVFVGSVESIAHAVDPTARTVLARIRIANHRELLRVGLFGSARIALESGTAGVSRLVVPVSAVTDVAGKKIVFVLEADREFAVHEVTVGRSAEGYYEVLGGLRLGDSVVVDGAFTLKSLLLKASFGEEE